ncbi:MAG: hypothetical protein GY946_27830 [bacterium]|nr:hypothetical protein [bacterium]
MTMPMTSNPAQTQTRAQTQYRCLGPMRGIFVSLALGAAGWLMVVAMARAVHALVS